MVGTEPLCDLRDQAFVNPQLTQRASEPLEAGDLDLIAVLLRDNLRIDDMMRVDPRLEVVTLAEILGQNVHQRRSAAAKLVPAPLHHRKMFGPPGDDGIEQVENHRLEVVTRHEESALPLFPRWRRGSGASHL